MRHIRKIHGSKAYLKHVNALRDKLAKVVGNAFFNKVDIHDFLKLGLVLSVDVLVFV